MSKKLGSCFEAMQRNKLGAELGEVSLHGPKRNYVRTRIVVDKAKIQVIERLPPPTSVKGIRSFLGHARFYRQFIKDFSKITKRLCNLLEKM